MSFSDEEIVLMIQHCQAFKEFDQYITNHNSFFHRVKIDELYDACSKYGNKLYEEIGCTIQSQILSRILYRRFRSKVCRYKIKRRVPECVKDGWVLYIGSLILSVFCQSQMILGLIGFTIIFCFWRMEKIDEFDIEERKYWL